MRFPRQIRGARAVRTAPPKLHLPRTPLPFPTGTNAAATSPPTESLPADSQCPSPQCQAPTHALAHTTPRSRPHSPMPAVRATPQLPRPGPTRMSPNIFSVSSTSNIRRPLHQQHRRRIDILVSQLHLGIIFAHARHHFAPQARTFQHVGLVDRQDLALAASSPTQMQRAQSARSPFPRISWC